MCQRGIRKELKPSKQLLAAFCKKNNGQSGVIKNYALLFSSVIDTGFIASLGASDTGPIS